MFVAFRATLLGVMIACLAVSPETASANPNHLEPIPAYDPEGYDQAVFGALIGSSYPELWMVCKPSFSSEDALILRSELVNPEPKLPPAPPDPKRWILEKATAAEPIWRWKEYPPGYTGPMELKLRKDIQVNRTKLVIEESLAQEVKKAWLAVLRQTRYSEEDYRGLDGTTYQFYAQHNYFGEIWSPQTGLPKQLVELSGLLLDAIDCTPEKRQELLAECEAKAKALHRAAEFRGKGEDAAE